MQKIILTAILTAVTLFADAQNLDLIVTSKNDSIACVIDSIGNDQFYFTVIRNGRKMHTHIPTPSVSDYKYDFILNYGCILIYY